MAGSDVKLRILSALIEPSPRGHFTATEAVERLDTYRDEVLAETKVETVAWLVKKAAEQGAWDASVLASKIDRGAVRAFLGTGHYQDAKDAHRAKVLNEAADVAEMVGSEFFDNAHSGEGNGAMAVAAELRERASILTPADPEVDERLVPGAGDQA